jgi:two-component system, cell cycle sensor histidine kinase and response regulator CckA
LATVYGIVKQHQGWVAVSSQAGAGATFKVFLPATPLPALATALPPVQTKLSGGHETILLVEDEPSVRFVTRRALESYGYEIVEASSAREALEVWPGQAEEIALLLTDMVMTGNIMGQELAERLRAQKPNLKVIFMSGYSPDSPGKDTPLARRTKVEFLQKPFTMRMLLESVRRCLDGK